MKEINYILGLPITTDTISEEFLEFINSEENKIIVTTGSFFFNGQDYTLTKVGFDQLMRKGFKIFGNNKERAFIPPNVNKSILQINLDFSVVNSSPDSILEYIENIIDSLDLEKSDTVCYACPGSPYLYDSLSKTIINKYKDIKVIDTKSSADIIKEKLEIDKPVEIIYSNQMNFNEDSLNIFGCLGSNYVPFNVQSLMQNIKNYDKIYQIKLGYKQEEFIREVYKEQIIYELGKNIDYFSDSTLAMHKS